jgi:protein-L-isoaspartate(D-aspartate) O-methyltransferase
MESEAYYTSECERMLRYQIVARGITSARLLEALREVPRHLFVPPDVRHMAYADCALPIESGQTISQPYIVALMSSLMDLKGSERVLEVGTGSGYQAAILSRLTAQVHTIERHERLAQQAARLLKDLGLENIRVHVGDGSLGLAQHAPYDAIMVTAAAPRVPAALLAQLQEGGRLVLPVGGRGSQSLEVWTRQGEHFESEEVLPVAFVPLVGEQGWKESSGFF